MFGFVNLLKPSKNNQDHQEETFLRFFAQISLQDVTTCVIILS